MQSIQHPTSHLCNKVSRCHDGAANVMGRIRHVLESTGKKGHYDGLIAVLQEYRQGFATAEDVVSYVSRVLGPYPTLAIEFSEFLPEGVTLFSRPNHPAFSHRTARRENVQSSALRFIARIRATDSTLRDPFVVALEEWKRGECELVQMYETVKALFDGHPDLLDAFHSFLSPSDREILLGSSSSEASEDEDDVPSLMCSSSSSVSNSPSSHGTPEGSPSSPFDTLHSSPKIGSPNFLATDEDNESLDESKHSRISPPSFPPPSKRRRLLNKGQA